MSIRTCPESGESEELAQQKMLERKGVFETMRVMELMEIDKNATGHFPP
jgi:hypothetical protein